MLIEAWLKEHKPEVYWPMLQTAETVAKRYKIPREKQDEYGVQSQQRAAAAQAAGRFTAEIVPMTTIMGVADKDTRPDVHEGGHDAADEGIRADTTYEGVSKIKPAMPGGVIAAGNASQFSDGAAACVVMDAKLAEKKGLKPLGIFRGFAVAGCEPDEMGIGPVFAIPKLLERAGLKVEDIGLWELNEAFAVQVHLLPRQAGHSRRPPERQRRRDRGRPPVRHVRRPLDRSRADRRQAARRKVRGRHHVHRRRPGRGGVVRGGVSGYRIAVDTRRFALMPALRIFAGIVRSVFVAAIATTCIFACGSLSAQIIEPYYADTSDYDWPAFHVTDLYSIQTAGCYATYADSPTVTGTNIRLAMRLLPTPNCGHTGANFDVVVIRISPLRRRCPPATTRWSSDTCCLMAPGFTVSRAC